MFARIVCASARAHASLWWDLVWCMVPCDGAVPRATYTQKPHDSRCVGLWGAAMMMPPCVHVLQTLIVGIVGSTYTRVFRVRGTRTLVRTDAPLSAIVDVVCA